jgi:hypothetical protein
MDLVIDGEAFNFFQDEMLLTGEGLLSTKTREIRR